MKKTNYQRSINVALFHWLVELCYKFYTTKEDQHYSDISSTIKDKYSLIASDYSLLKHFGLIKSGKRGFYHPTTKAYQFLNNDISIPLYYYGENSFSKEQIFACEIVIEEPRKSWKKIESSLQTVVEPPHIKYDLLNSFELVDFI